ncbi:MAG: hypothetical protein GC171_08600 [Terrimonas sp.]|nr:hypothetical protein [Terrimonas sp.]
MKRNLILIVTVFFSFCSRAQKNEPFAHTLLWRISGHGMTMPSYLFGTMHVTDKKAFNFPDSLYYFIEHTDAFAMEFHPDSANALMMSYMEGDIEMDKEPVDVFSEKEMKELEKNISKEVKEKYKNKKGSLVKYFFNNIIGGDDKKDDNSMNTFMDAYLFDVARSNGKSINGLENGIDQLKALSSLSSGFNKKKISEFIQKWDVNQNSPIQEFYYQGDLNGIENFFTEFFSEAALKTFLYDRNLVMVKGMEEIMQTQRLFTAVGAGHLPGERGIISLLRNRGYTVEPVFTDKRISADDYQLKAFNTKNYVMKVDEHRFQVELPGIPQKRDGAQGRLVSMYYDLAGGMFYMTVSGRLTSEDKNKGAKAVIDQHLEEMVENVGGKMISRKPITQQGLEGEEMECAYTDKGKSRYRELLSENMFYILIVISENKNNLVSEKAEQFFSSFRVLAKPLVTPYALEQEDEGFKIRFPGKPRQEPIKLNSETDKRVSLNSYSFFDINTGNNYTVIVTRSKEGGMLKDPNTFFDSYEKNIASSYGESRVTTTDTVLGGFPAKYFITDPVNSNQVMGLIIKRNNTGYFITTEFDSGNDFKKAGDEFLASFALQPFAKSTWRSSASPDKDFTAWVPAPVKLNKEEDYELTSNDDETKSYYAFDPHTLAYYYIAVSPVSKYYWADNTDSIYNDWKSNVITTYRDSLIAEKVVTNGGITGREFVFTDQYTHQITRARLLLNGNRKYQLSMETYDPGKSDVDEDKFFDAFRFTRESDASLITGNTPSVLFRDLVSEDSAVFQAAYNAWYGLHFEKKYLPLLLEQSLVHYPEYENNYLTVNEKIFGEIIGMKGLDDQDRKRISEYIQQKYQEEDSVIENNRFYMLGVLASLKTKESFSLINDLLRDHIPQKGSPYRLYSNLNDSLALTLQLFPRLYELMDDSIHQEMIIPLLTKMLDSGFLHVQDIALYQEKIRDLGREKLNKSLKLKSDDYDYTAVNMIDLLQRLRKDETDALINQYLRVKPVSIKEPAAIALLKNGKAVSQQVLKDIATDQYYRAELYDELDKLGKQSLFPSLYRNQSDMAESYLYQSVLDEDDLYGEQEYIYIKKMTKMIEGKNKRFYLFRINFTEEQEEGEDPVVTSYLGIAGPFDLDEKSIGIKKDKNLSGVYYDDEFSGDMLDSYFEQYINDRIKWMKE